MNAKPAAASTVSVVPGSRGQAVTVAGLAALKQLPEGELRQLGLRDGRGCVSIPYYSEDGVAIAEKRRTAWAAKDGSFWPRNIALLAYGLWQLDMARKWNFLYLVEGESDCWALWHHKVPALGLPGANTVKTLTAEALVGIQTLYVSEESDRGGKSFVAGVAKRLGELGWAGTAKVLRMPAGCKDPADLHCRHAKDGGFIKALTACKEGATPLNVKVRTSAPAPAGSDDDGLPTIQITTRLLEVNDAAIRALTRDDRLYQRSGQLVEIRSSEHEGEGPQIAAISRDTLRERLAAVAHWRRSFESDKGVSSRLVNPPEWSVGGILSRGQWAGIKRLRGVVECPVLLHDGSVLTAPGYDPQSGLCLDWSREALTIPTRPSKGQVASSVAALGEVIKDFPFASPEHKAAWYAALLTPLARFAFEGPTPLFLVDGNAPGVGKGLLVKSIITLLSGRQATPTKYPDAEEERRKFITGLALGGFSYVWLDNLTGRFGDPVIDAALTSTAWRDRLFHTQQQQDMRLVSTWYGTGNNLHIVGDTGRRILPIRLESSVEHPERRAGFSHPDLLAWVREQRPRLLAAALTILRGYCAASRPRQQLAAWGSYEGWTALVRAAIVWAGLPDIRGSSNVELVTVDHEKTAISALLKCLEQLDTSGRGLTVGQILGEDPALYDMAVHRKLRTILAELLGEKNLDTRRVGNLLAKYWRRILDDRFLDRKVLGGANHWRVRPGNELR